MLTAEEKIKTTTHEFICKTDSSYVIAEDRVLSAEIRGGMHSAISEKFPVASSKI